MTAPPRAGSGLVPGTWADAEALVGTVLAEFEGADPVSLPDIRRRLEVLQLDCPLHHDADVAREQGYRDVVSPASMIRAWATPAYWRPGEPPTGTRALYAPVPASNIPAPGDRQFATGSKTTHVLPVHPGDRISGIAVLKSLTRKSISVGDGAFMVIETTFRNQHGETVARDEITVFRFTAHGEDGHA
ncbi:MAG TPA: MaoC family dehydratase N-terminal domain-containing protein [Baekduia sp.]